MKPWDVFKRGVGCLSLFVTLCFGLLIGYCICWFEEWSTPYIDRRTAIRYGLENAQAHCAETTFTHPVDCTHFRLTSVQEGESGWALTFTSIDGRRTESMIIRRKGEYDGTGMTNLDDTDGGPVQNSPAPAPPSRSPPIGRVPQ